MDYSEFIVANCPETVIYIPNFITSEEEQQIIGSVKNAPKPKWTQLAHRRLLNYGGIPHKNGMIAEEIPKWLQVFVAKINSLGIFDNEKGANHVLVNEYLSGQGIMPHLDGPLFFPVICTISCGSHTILQFHHSNETQNTTVTKLLIEPRSLVILKDEMYHQFLHSIAEINSDVIDDTVLNLNGCEQQYKFGDRLERTTRISLTIRNVPKTSKMKLKF